MNLRNFRGQQRGASQEPWDRTLMWRGDTDPAASDLQCCAEISGHDIAGQLIFHCKSSIKLAININVLLIITYVLRTYTCV